MTEQDRIELCRDLERLAFGGFNPKIQKARRFDTDPADYSALKRRLRSMGFHYQVQMWSKVEPIVHEIIVTDMKYGSYAENESEALAFCLAAREALREREKSSDHTD